MCQSQDLKSIIGLQVQSCWTCNQTFHLSLTSPPYSLVGPQFILRKQVQSKGVPVTLLDALGEAMAA